MPSLNFHAFVFFIKSPCCFKFVFLLWMLAVHQMMCILTSSVDHFDFTETDSNSWALRDQKHHRTWPYRIHSRVGWLFEIQKIKRTIALSAS
jgi:hypothetical protein